MDELRIQRLVAEAWQVRKNALVLGKTPVGAAVLAESGQVYVGCNVEHRFRSHDVHAEVNALTSMVADGCGKGIAIAVASQREYFTPCGACMDWIFELGGEECLILVTNKLEEVLLAKTAKELMPFYPY